MSHEVIKRVGTRAYRYRVESVRDPQTRKMRPRWIYLGVAESPGEASAHVTDRQDGAREVRRPGGDTRERLFLAFERLAARESFASITAGAVAAEAGLAHGTFYRYFRDKRDLFRAAVERLRDELNRSSPSFAPPYGSREQERARVRAWFEAVFARKADQPGVLRAYYETLESDPGFRTERAQRRGERAASFAAYLESLADAGTIAPLPSLAVATALLTLVEAAFRGTAAGSGGIDPTLAAGVAAVVDRSLFGAEPA